MVALIGTYVFAQGVADHGKEAAKKLQAGGVNLPTSALRSRPEAP